MAEKPVAVVVPSWDPNEPRFVIEDATEYTSDDRAFKNGKCVYNQRLGFAYSIDEIVEVLNNDELEKQNERLKIKIERERNATTKQHLKWSNEAEEQIQKLQDENEQLKKENKELRQYLGWQQMELEELEDIDKNVIR